MPSQKESFLGRTTQFVLLSVVVFSLGCGEVVHLVQPGQPVRLAEPVKAKVAVPDGSGGWKVGSKRVEIPAGWYAVPPPTTQP